jgi:hypothetical protein
MTIDNELHRNQVVSADLQRETPWWHLGNDKLPGNMNGANHDEDVARCTFQAREVVNVDRRSLTVLEASSDCLQQCGGI